jgi:flagellar FliL protein
LCVRIKEDEVAEEKAAAPADKAAAAGPEAGASGASKKQSLILMVLAVVNMVVIFGVGFMIYQGRKKDAAEPKIEHVIKGEAETQEKEKKEEKEVVGKVIPLDTFLVNFAGSKGRRVAKVNMEMAVEGEGVVSEIDQRKAQVRDIIIILLSGKTYDQVANREGKDKLKEQIRDTVNAFLTKGKIKEVYFTEFIYN